MLVLRHFHREITTVHDQAGAVLADFDGEEVHRGRTDETGHEQVGWAIIQMLRRIQLLEQAFVHDRDAGRHGHGFHLVMGHVNKGGLQALVQFADLGAGLNAQFCVQVGQRFVEEEDLRLAHDGASDRHTLALTT